MNVRPLMNEVSIHRHRPIWTALILPCALGSSLWMIWFFLLGDGSEIKKLRWLALLAIPGLIYFGFQARAWIRGPMDLVLGFTDSEFYANGCAAVFGDVRIDRSKIDFYSIEPRMNVNGVHTARWLVAYLRDDSEAPIVNFWRSTAGVSRKEQNRIAEFIRRNGYRIEIQ